MHPAATDALRGKVCRRPISIRDLHQDHEVGRHGVPVSLVPAIAEPAAADGAHSANKKLAKRLDELETRIEKKLTTHDQAIAAMLSAIRQLLNPPRPKRRPIGFTADLDEKA